MVTEEFLDTSNTGVAKEIFIATPSAALSISKPAARPVPIFFATYFEPACSINFQACPFSPSFSQSPRVGLLSSKSSVKGKVRAVTNFATYVRSANTRSLRRASLFPSFHPTKISFPSGLASTGSVISSYSFVCTAAPSIFPFPATVYCTVYCNLTNFAV